MKQTFVRRPIWFWFQAVRTSVRSVWCPSVCVRLPS